MKRLKVLGLTIMAVFMLSAMASASAWAVALPEFSVQTNFTGKSGAGKLVAVGIEIKCTAGSNTGTATSKTAGNVTLTFTGCTLGTKKCSTAGDVAGTVLIASTYTLVRLASGKAGIDIKTTEKSIECEGSTIKVKGEVLGELTPVLTKTKAFKLIVAVVEKKQAITEYENNAGEKKKLTEPLVANIGLGFVSATEESAENNITAEKETEITKTTVRAHVGCPVPGLGERNAARAIGLRGPWAGQRSTLTDAAFGRQGCRAERPCAAAIHLSSSRPPWRRQSIGSSRRGRWVLGTHKPQ